MTIIQSQRMIDALKKAGYKRSEFQVRTARQYCGRDWRGRPAYEYGDAQILVFASKERQFELLEAVAQQGIDIVICVLDGRNCYPSYKDAHKDIGKIEYKVFESKKGQ